MRKSIHRATGLALLVLLALATYSLWPWLENIHTKFGPLFNYRVYDPPKWLDGYTEQVPGGWRIPTSRWELISRPNGEIMDDKRQLNRFARQGKRPTRTIPPVEPMEVRADDELRDFVIDYGEYYGYPQTQDERDDARTRGKAYRSSAFFNQRFFDTKPFYGEIPTWLVMQDTGPDRGNLHMDQWESFKDGKPVHLMLPRLKQPQVTIVSAGGFYNARQAAYDNTPPIAYRSEQYWAVVFAGTRHSGPRAYFMDRVNIGKNSTEILLHRPRAGFATADSHPYWFFVPLGRLPDGPYSVEVTLVDDDTTMASTSANLRTATEKENEERGAKYTELSEAANRRYSATQMLQNAHGAKLQLQLERVAEFIHAQQPDATARDILTSDITELGKAVDWNVDAYSSSRHDKRDLAPPTPGQQTENPFRKRAIEPTRRNWEPSNIKLSDIWLCDGTDATWFAQPTYRDVPEFESALTADRPHEVQQKIRRIWQVLIENSKERNAIFKSLPAKGSIHDALDTAFETFVNKQEPDRNFSPNDETWAVFIAKNSFVIRSIQTRSYEDQYDKSTRTEYLVHTSADVAAADGVAEDAQAPITFALIPLGKQKSDSVGIEFDCDAISCRNINAAEPAFLDALPPQQLFIDYARYLGGSTGFRIQPSR